MVITTTVHTRLRILPIWRELTKHEHPPSLGNINELAISTYTYSMSLSSCGHDIMKYTIEFKPIQQSQTNAKQNDATFHDKNRMSVTVSSATRLRERHDLNSDTASTATRPRHWATSLATVIGHRHWAPTGLSR